MRLPAIWLILATTHMASATYNTVAVSTALRLFAVQYKSVCKSEMVVLDDSGVGVSLESLATSGSLTELALAPVAALHMCASVEGSLSKLSRFAVAFYAKLLGSGVVLPSRPNMLSALCGVVQQLLVQGRASRYGDLTLLGHLVNLLQFLRDVSPNPLHQLYVVGFMFENFTFYNTRNGPDNKFEGAVLEFLRNFSKKQDNLARLPMNGLILHNFFQSISRAKVPTAVLLKDSKQQAAQRVVVFEKLIQTKFPHFRVDPDQDPANALVLAPFHPAVPALPPGALAPPGEAGAQLVRVLVANDGKLWDGKPTLDALIAFAADEEADFVVISEGSVTSDDPESARTVGQYKVKLAGVPAGEGLRGGMGLAFKSELEPHTSLEKASTSDGFDIAALGVAKGVRIVGLYPSPTNLNEKGRAVMAMRKWRDVAQAVMQWNLLGPPLAAGERQVRHEVLVAGDMNAASGTLQRLVVDAGMQAMELRLLNPDMVTFQKVGGVQKDLDLLFGSAGVEMLSAQVSPKARTNDHERITADLLIQARPVANSYLFADVNANANHESCMSFSCLLNKAVLNPDRMSPFEVAEHYVTQTLNQPEAKWRALTGLRGSRGVWSGQVYGAREVKWGMTLKALSGKFTQADVGEALSWLQTSCLSCHQLPPFEADSLLGLKMQKLLMADLVHAVKTGHMVDDLAAPVLEKMLIDKLKPHLDAWREGNPFSVGRRRVFGCSSWSDDVSQDQEQEAMLALLARVASEELNVVNEKLFVASLNFPRIPSHLVTSALSIIAEALPATADLLNVVTAFLSVHGDKSFALTRQLGCLALADAVITVGETAGSIRVTTPANARFRVQDSVWAGGVVVFARTENGLKNKLAGLVVKLSPLEASQLDIMTFPSAKNVRMEIGGEPVRMKGNLRLPLDLLLLQSNPRMIVNPEKIRGVISRWMATRMFLPQVGPHRQRLFRYLVDVVLKEAVKGAEVALDSGTDFSEFSNMIVSAIAEHQNPPNNRIPNDMEIVCATSFKSHPSYLIYRRMAALLARAMRHATYGELFKSLASKVHKQDNAPGHYFSNQFQDLTVKLGLDVVTKKTGTWIASLAEPAINVNAKLAQFDAALDALMTRKLQAEITTKNFATCAVRLGDDLTPIGYHAFKGQASNAFLSVA